MIELLSIFISFSILLSFSLFPCKINFKDGKKNHNHESIFDLLFLNLTINVFIILLISFTKLDYSKYFLLILIASIIFNLFNLSKKKKLF